MIGNTSGRKPGVRAKSGRLSTVLKLFIAWCVVPVLILTGTESFLRYRGYGQSTLPYLPHVVNGVPCAVVNMAYYSQFMPLWPDSVRTTP